MKITLLATSYLTKAPRFKQNIAFSPPLSLFRRYMIIITTPNRSRENYENSSLRLCPRYLSLMGRSAATWQSQPSQYARRNTHYETPCPWQITKLLWGASPAPLCPRYLGASMCLRCMLGKVCFQERFVPSYISYFSRRHSIFPLKNIMRAEVRRPTFPANSLLPVNI